jgi:hypothetical protein
MLVITHRSPVYILVAETVSVAHAMDVFPNNYREANKVVEDLAKIQVGSTIKDNSFCIIARG